MSYSQILTFKHSSLQFTFESAIFLQVCLKCSLIHFLWFEKCCRVRKYLIEIWIKNLGKVEPRGHVMNEKVSFSPQMVFSGTGVNFFLYDQCNNIALDKFRSKWFSYLLGQISFMLWLSIKRSTCDSNYATFRLPWVHSLHCPSKNVFLFFAVHLRISSFFR